MVRLILSKYLPFARERHVDELNFRFAEPDQIVKPTEVSTALGITQAQALALLAEIAGSGHGTLGIVVYHVDQCDENTPSIQFLTAQDGLPSFPWRCQLCDRMVQSEAEVVFAMATYFPAAVHFEWVDDAS